MLSLLHQLIVKLRGDKRCKSSEHGDEAGGHLRRARIERTQIAKISPTFQDNRDRDITLKFAEVRHILRPVVGIDTRMLDDDRCPGRPRFKAQCCIEREISPWFYAQVDIVMYGTGG